MPRAPQPFIFLALHRNITRSSETPQVRLCDMRMHVDDLQKSAVRLQLRCLLEEVKASLYVHSWRHNNGSGLYNKSSIMFCFFCNTKCRCVQGCRAAALTIRLNLAASLAFGIVHTIHHQTTSANIIHAIQTSLLLDIYLADTQPRSYGPLGT